MPVCESCRGSFTEDACVKLARAVLGKHPALRIIRRLVRRVKAQEKVLIAYRLGSSSLSETTHRELDATRDAVEEAESYLERNA